MTDLSQGSHGAEVQRLQNQLISLGFLGGRADGEFGLNTAQAVRDLQRRLLLEPDGLVGADTRAALAALERQDSVVVSSVYNRLYRRALALAAQGTVNPDHLPILDLGLGQSAYTGDPARYAARLESSPPSAELQPYPAPAASFTPYPSLGVLPSILEGCSNRGGLEFLSDEVAQACVCVGSFASDQRLRVRWYGRNAVTDNKQFWSASKFVAPLLVVCQANRRSPGTPISRTSVHALDGRRLASFATLFKEMVTYAPSSGGVDNGNSNRVAYMFKRLLNGGEPDVQAWLRSISGNHQAQLMSWHGNWKRGKPSDPPIDHPFVGGVELRADGGERLVGYREERMTRNWLSAYDLVRMITMLGWHPQLTRDQRLPAAQWSSLQTLVEGLGHDTARYLDVALQELGLSGAVAEPVIISKLGYGDYAADNPSAPALTYVAFASFRDTRTTPPRQRCFSLALRIPTARGLDIALRHDARMGAEVTEIVRRVFAEELG